ncbi:predicted protein [Postia placenta Mad-698-R]|nr:predicted protein [Postia placenta Mad-698-R]
MPESLTPLPTHNSPPGNASKLLAAMPFSCSLSGLRRILSSFSLPNLFQNGQWQEAQDYIKTLETRVKEEAEARSRSEKDREEAHKKNDSLGKQLEHTRRETEEAQRGAQEAQRKMEEAQHKAKDVQRGAADVRRGTDEAQRRAEDAQHGADDARAQVAKQEESLHRLEETLAQVQTDLQTTKQHLDDREQQYTALEAAYRKTTHLLEMRTAELQGSQRYLTKTDALSDTEVLRDVERINATILHDATSIADSVSFEPSADRALPADPTALTQLLGVRMVELLQKVSHHGDPFCVQLALQACMAAFARDVLPMWTTQSENDTFLDTVYAGIWEHETQAIAGRWRTLARSYLHRQLREQGAIAELHHWLATLVVQILRLAGAAGTEQEVSHVVSVRHTERLRSFIDICIDVNKAIGEGVLSADFKVLSADCGSGFNEDIMKDDYGSAASMGTGEGVLCMVAVGIQRLDKQDDGQRRAITLLKPGVALDSITSELTWVEDSSERKVEASTI